MQLEFLFDRSQGMLFPFHWTRGPNHQQPGRLTTLFGGGKLSKEQRDNCFWALRNLPAVLERYLLVLGSGFTSGPAAAKWVETCGVFLTQVKRVLAALEQPPA